MEHGLDAPESDGVSHRRFDEVGQGLARSENALEFSAQLWFNADLGYDSRLHRSKVLCLSDGCSRPRRSARPTGRRKSLAGLGAKSEGASDE
jgi:hypothetical protein